MTSCHLYERHHWNHHSTFIPGISLVINLPSKNLTFEGRCGRAYGSSGETYDTTTPAAIGKPSIPTSQPSPVSYFAKPLPVDRRGSPHFLVQLPSRLAPLGRKGHTATVAPLRDQACVFIFGGAPAGRRGLSQAIYSVELSRLSIGEGTWERHRPGGTAPAAREGHTLTAVSGGKRLVLFGGVGEDGKLLRDVQVKCVRPRTRLRLPACVDVR